MKLVTAAQMQAMDRRAIGFGVPGVVLMENAGVASARIIHERWGDAGNRRLVVVAGKGNNGGDGHVIARCLRERGWQVSVFVLARRKDVSGDALTNLLRLDETSVRYLPDEIALKGVEALLGEADVIVDALFGTGLTSELRGIHATAVQMINRSGRPVMAVDIPSGIDATTGRVLGCAVHADLTVTFANAKLGHVLYPGAGFVGRLHTVDIGIPPAATEGVEFAELLDADAVRPLIPLRRRTSHKGSNGHCLIIAGSTGKTGAAAMAANSAVRAGAGLVTLAVPASLNPILEIKTTEAMTAPLPDGGSGRLGDGSLPVPEELLAGKNIVAIGPGVGWHSETARMVRALVAELTLPLVVDADGLNALSEDPGILAGKKSPCLVLTPHPGEMARLTGTSVAEVERDRIAAARDFACKMKVYVVLKGARSVLASPEGEIAINGSGNPGMGSGGSGDVLTGILAALLAQGLDPWDACRLGVFIHGHAADLVAADKGEIGMSAVDIQERIPYSFNNLLTVHS